MTISVSDIIAALTAQQEENESLKGQIERLHDEAFAARQLIWQLAQAQGVKQDQPYSPEDVINKAVAQTLAASEGGMKLVATVLSPDPYDERGGPWFSNADLKAMDDLPPGTKLYVAAAQ